LIELLQQFLLKNVPGFTPKSLYKQPKSLTKIICFG